MKRILPTTQYYFNAGSSNIDFSMYLDFDPKRLLAVINTSKNQVLIFATGGGDSSPTRGNFTGSLGAYFLQLNFDTASAGMSDTDVLQIIYDESVGTEEAKATIDIVSGKAGLDVNLLNSSFGGTLGDVMPAPFQDNALSIGILSGGVLEAPSINMNNELIVDVTQSGTVPIAGVVSVSSGDVTVNNFPASQAVTGTFWQATQPISATALPLPNSASTSSLQTTGNNSLSSIDTKTPALGQALAASSVPVVLTAAQISTLTPLSSVNTFSPDLFITGQAAQTAIINNIIPVTAGATATDCAGYKSFSIQIISTATAGSVIFEGSNDNVNFQVVPVYNQALANPAILLSSITATASTIIYTGSVQVRYLRLRIVTLITGGSIQAFTRLSTNSFAQTVTNVAQAVAASLLTTATIASGTITTVTSSNSATPSIIADVASAALTTTTTTATLTPTFGKSYQVNIPVTVVSGTSPTLDITIEESDDTGTNWYKVYDFPRITTTGIYRSPQIPFFGNRVRYVQTVGGTTPSFTRAINRLQSSYPAIPQRQLIDRTIVLTTLNSTTALILARDCGNATQLVVSVGAITTTAPAIQLEGSDDFGTTWYSIGSPLTAIANSTVQVTVNGINAAALRARVSTAGVGVTANYIMIKAHD